MKMMPVGIEDFDTIRRNNFYYVDKTQMIADLLNNWALVNLYTRPRRFGKTLNISMLRRFFEYGTSPELFEGLAIAKEKELCEKYMGKFPVISISLKDVDGTTYQGAKNIAERVIIEEALRFDYLADSPALNMEEKEVYKSLKNPDMSDAVFDRSLLILSQLLYKHHKQKVIILIDEYDVPLDKAYQKGYYDEMIGLIRAMFSSALKTNETLMFSVITGCLRISKESIFTGFNNPRILGITDIKFDEYFGFTEAEVKEMLAYYSISNRYDEAKEWYDGYLFGEKHVYCPWDMINFVYDVKDDPIAQPKAYWINTSSNNLLKNFVSSTGMDSPYELEELLAGESVTKEVRQDLTYREINEKEENLWSILFMTGYLTVAKRPLGKEFELVIPNREIREIFGEKVMELFKEEVRTDTERLDRFFDAFWNEKPDVIEEMFNEYLDEHISIRDINIKKEMKENFYHGYLLGILQNMKGTAVRSNRESGDGYADILLESRKTRTGIVIEVKYADVDMAKIGYDDDKLRERLAVECRNALEQIEDKRYGEVLRQHGMKKIIWYGIACFRKECMVEMELPTPF